MAFYYDEDLAKLLIWQNKINQVETKRNKLKAELLSILSFESFPTPHEIETMRRNFNEVKNRVLHNKSGQGYFWVPHFDWFWKVVNWLSSSFGTNPSHSGSRLRRILKEEVELKFPESLNNIDYNTLKALVITPEQLQQALLESDFQTILSHVKYQLINDPTNQSNIRLIHSLRYKLSPNLYCNLLEVLYQKQPINTLGYFYSLHGRNRNRIADDHTFIELNLFARFVTYSWLEIIPTFKESTDGVSYNATYKIERLLILLLISSDETITGSDINDTPMMKLITHNDHESIDSIYENTMRTENIEKFILSLGLKDNPSSCNILEKLLFNVNESLLFEAIGRQTIELIYTSYLKSCAKASLQRSSGNITSNWNNPKNARTKTLLLLIHSLIDPHQSIKLSTFPTESRRNDFVKSISPEIHCTALIPGNYARLEACSASLIFALFYNELEFKKALRKVRLGPVNLSADDLSWIENRILAAIANEQKHHAKSVELINYCFKNLIIYDEDMIGDIEILTDQPKILFQNLDELLSFNSAVIPLYRIVPSQKKDPSLPLLNPQDENMRMAEAIQCFKTLLNLPLTSEDLEILYAYLQKLNYHISPALKQRWEDDIKLKNSLYTRCNATMINDDLVVKNFDDLLGDASTYLENALSCKEKFKFIEEVHNAVRCANSFELIFKRDLTSEEIATVNVTFKKACARGYISPDLAKRWSKPSLSLANNPNSLMGRKSKSRSIELTNVVDFKVPANEASIVQHCAS